MKAAVVTEPGRSPTYSDFVEPEPQEGSELIEVAASALTNVTRTRVSGAYPGAASAFPLIAGVDGVGRTADGTRVFFLLPDAPYGAMGELTRVRREFIAPVPDALDDVVAAALINPGLSPIAALQERAGFAAGETVLIQDATGTTGMLAVQLAKKLGARRVIAAGRNAEALERLRNLGADATIDLTNGPDALKQAIAGEFSNGRGIDIVLDYLYGEPAERLLSALSAVHHGTGTLRYVITGGAAGTPQITLPASWLVSSRIDLLASGVGRSSWPSSPPSRPCRPGSVSPSPSGACATRIPGCRNRPIRPASTALDGAASSALPIDMVTLPLEDVERTWTDDHGRSRVVFTVP